MAAADVTRRRWLASGAAAGLAARPAGAASGADPESDGPTPLFRRAAADAAAGLRRPAVAPWERQVQIFYPRWMFGAWTLAFRREGSVAPLGAAAAPVRPPQLLAAPAGEGVEIEARFYSTLPDTLRNNLAVNLGLLPSDAIIADRAFNVASLNAGGGVAGAEYSTREKPGEMEVRYRSDGPAGPRKAVIYYQNARGEEGSTPAGDGGGLAAAFATSEMVRQVNLGVRSVETQDFEVITAYTRHSPTVITGRLRLAAYLTPQDADYFVAFGRPVEVDDWSFTMVRRETPGVAAGVVCVETPKDVIQCV